MTTAASTSVTGTEIQEEGELSGAILDENTWCFEISNKTDYLESGLILPYPMEIFVSARSLSMEEDITLKVTVTQMIDYNDPPPSLPGNRQLGPIVRFEADQAHVQFVRPLLVFIRFPEEFLKHTDDYEYCVQYNSGKDIHGGIWNDITGYREGQVSGEVIQSHQTAVLLLNHFSLFTIFRRSKLLNVELHAYHIQQQDTHHVLVTCLVYLKPLRGTAEYQEELDSIKGQLETSEALALSKNDEAKEVVLVGHQREPWHLEEEQLRTQIIQIQPLLENHFMKKHYVFQGQGQSSFSCHIEANIPGRTANPRVLIPLQVKNSIDPRFFQHLSAREKADLSERHMSDSIKNHIKEVLNSNRINLTEYISVNEELWNHLIAKGVLSMQQRQNIKAQYVGNDRATGIIDLVYQRPHSYVNFRQCLLDSNQRHVVDDYLPPIREFPHGEP